MPKKIADHRVPIKTIEEADALMGRLARAVKKLNLLKARKESQVARIKEQFETLSAPMNQDIAAMEAELSAFIMAHQGLFAKPKQRVTTLGKYGLRKAAKVDVFNADACLEWALKNGHDECVEVVRKPNKEGLRRHIESGDDVPGATLLDGEIATYKVSKEFLEDDEG